MREYLSGLSVLLYAACLISVQPVKIYLEQLTKVDS